MTEMMGGEQIEIWRKELATAVTGEQWRLALKLCSWLRYALAQQGLSDPEVEEIHRQAKEALAEQMVGEKVQQEREREREGRLDRLRRQAMNQIVSARWNQALDSIETLYRDRANRQEVIPLLRELKIRSATLLQPTYRRADPRADALGRRFDELVELVGGGSLISGNWPQDKSIG